MSFAIVFKMPRVRFPPDWSAGIDELPEPIPGVGKQRLLPQVVNSMKDLPFLFCGPPGIGKKSLVQLAAQQLNLKVECAYDLGQIAGESKVYPELLQRVTSWFGGRLQKDVMGERRLLVLYGAEHLADENAAFLRKYDVVLLANERTQALKAQFGDRTVWANKLTDVEMRRSLAILQPSARAAEVDTATKIANGDLRKAQQHLMFGTAKAEKAKNIYFEVSDALCKGVHVNLDWHGRRWVSRNHLLLEKSIEEHAKFSEDLLIADLVHDPDHENAAPNCIGDTADVIAGMAVKDLVGRKRSNLKLQEPAYRQRPDDKYKYPSCRADLSAYFDATESAPKRQKAEDSSSSGSSGSSGSRPQPTASEPVYPVQASILQRPAREATASDLVQADDDVRVLNAQPECDFHKGCGLYRTNPREYNVAEGTESLPTCVDAQTDLRHAHWMIVEYAGDNISIAKTLMDKLPRCLIDAVANKILVVKLSQQNIRSQLATDRVQAKVQVLKMGKGKGRGDYVRAHRGLVTAFQQLPGKHVSNMCVRQTDEVETYSAKTLLDAVKDMTCEDYTKAVLDARLKNESGEELTALERLMCNKEIESRVKELRKLVGKIVTNVIYFSQAKGKVQAEKVFKDSWRKMLVTIHDRSLLTPEMPRSDQNKVTLDTFLKNPQLHQNVTLLMPGESRKGKTELAKYMCLLMCRKYQEENARFIMTNTLDSLRNVQASMLPGVPVLLDDIGGENSDLQLIYSSVSMWKAILQIKDATQNRARNDDLCWAARQPKIVTTNCKDLDDWIGTMFYHAKDEHKKAIQLRVAEVESITDSLYKNERAPSQSSSFLPSVMSTQQAEDDIASMLD